MKSSVVLTLAVTGLVVITVVIISITLTLSSDIRYAPDYIGFIQSNVDKNSIKTFLRKLSEHPRPAGSFYADQVANSIVKDWRHSGLDAVHKISYKIPVPRPNATNPNSVTVLSSRGETLFVSNPTQPPLDDGSSQDETLLTAYSPFSPNGVAKGLPVYVNYGLQKDYDYLEQHGISVDGSIAFIRNGGSFPGDKVRLAHAKGVQGVVLFNEPSIISQGNGDPTYPEGSGSPPEAIRMDSLTIYEKECGTTPGDCLASIPVQAISFSDAYEILRQMTGLAAPPSFGSNENFTYHVGPGLTGGRSVEITTDNVFNEVEVNDVIGIIWGEDEPDRYVVIGAHHDSLFYGAMDSGSGCAVQIELARIFGKMVLSKEWRPRRTLVFINWGAAEEGFASSYKYTSEFFTKLEDRALTYLDLNIIASGTTAFITSVNPVLKTVIEDVAKMVPGFSAQNTIYDFWKGEDSLPDERPSHFGLSGTESFASFMHNLGIASASMSFVDEKSQKYLPIYKTAYDTFHLVETSLDPEMVYHEAAARLYGLLIWRIANDHIIPFSLNDLADDMSSSFNELYEEEKDALAYFDANIGNLNETIRKFTSSVNEFQNLASIIDLNRDLLLRAMNDALFAVLKAFLSPEGVPGNPSYKYQKYTKISRNIE